MYLLYLVDKVISLLIIIKAVGY